MSKISNEEIARWFKEGQKEGITHLMIIGDTKRGKEFPVFITSKVNDTFDYYDGKPGKIVVKVFSLARNMESQLVEQHPMHLD